MIISSRYRICALPLGFSSERTQVSDRNLAHQLEGLISLSAYSGVLDDDSRPREGDIGRSKTPDAWAPLLNKFMKNYIFSIPYDEFSLLARVVL